MSNIAPNDDERSDSYDPDKPPDSLQEQWALGEEEAPDDEILQWMAEVLAECPPGYTQSNDVAPPIDPRWNEVSIDELSKPFEPPDWLCADLEIGPGRPGGILGADGAGKTDLAQTIALGVATGRRILGRFDCRRGRVAHLTYDMGKGAVILRYRRLANGLGIAPEELGWRQGLEKRLVVLAHPEINLTTKGAENLYAELFEGFDLAIVDNIRECVPGIDENDSRFGQYITMLGRAGARSGCIIVYLHHSGTDPMKAYRGSTSIPGASGALWHIAGEKEKPRDVKHVRLHDMSAGPKPPFQIVRSEKRATHDDAFDTGDYLAIVYTAQEKPSTARRAQNESDPGGDTDDASLIRARLLIEARTGGHLHKTKTHLVNAVTGNKQKKIDEADKLIAAGILIFEEGDKGCRVEE